MSDQPRYQMVSLGKQDRSGFACGVEALDRYFHRQVSQDVRAKVAACKLLIDRQNDAIAGFYTLSTAAVDLSALPAEKAKNLPRYPAIPIILLGRLAVDTRYHGQKLGSVLLVDAMKRCQEYSAEIGAYAIVVDAKDAQAARFYQHFGFETLPDMPHRLFLPIKTICQLFP